MDWSDFKPILDDYILPSVSILVLFLIAVFIANRVQIMVKKALIKGKVDDTLATFLSRIARWLVLILSTLSIIEKFGVDTTSFAAIIGAAGLAVGLALQGTLSNAAAGVMLLVFRPYSQGDVVSVAGVTGKVIELQLFATILDTPNNRRYIVPNGAIFGATIENITYHDKLRVDVTVGVSYDADIDEARAVLKAAGESVTPRLEDKDVGIVLVNLGDSTVDFQVRVWVSPDQYAPTPERILVACKKALDAANIGIPYPQMDLHVIDMPARNAGA